MRIGNQLKNMKNTLLLFFAGVLLALLAVGGYMAATTYFASADEESIPENIIIERVSPTTGQISFSTAKPVIASIDCAASVDGPFSLCGAETQVTDTHEIRTSIILEPDADYYFFITIRNTTYDNLGKPFVIPADTKPSVDSFPAKLFGTCTQDPDFDEAFDINKDGCIRQNDRMLFMEK